MAAGAGAEEKKSRARGRRFSRVEHTRDKVELCLRRRRREGSRGMEGRDPDGWTSWRTLYWSLRQVNREYERRGDRRRVLLSLTGVARALEQLRLEGVVEVRSSDEDADVRGDGSRAPSRRVQARYLTRAEREERARAVRRETLAERHGRAAPWPDMTLRQRTVDEVLAHMAQPERAAHGWYWPGPIVGRLGGLNERARLEGAEGPIVEETLDAVLRVWRDCGRQVEVQRCRNGALRARLRVTAAEADRRLEEARARRRGAVVDWERGWEERRVEGS